MKIRLIPERIRALTRPEDELLELPTVESLYAIRKLKAAVFYGTNVIDVQTTNQHGQVWLEEFVIWVDQLEYVKEPD